VLTASDWMESLFSIIHDHAQALGCDEAIARARRILAEGTSAHRQLAVYRQHRDAGGHRRQALQAVVQHLLVETATASQGVGSSHAS
jgi:glutamate---cysteine ligase / carboxylate-amine ligase